MRIPQDQFLRNDVLENRTRAVDVLQKQIQGGDALDKARFELCPLSTRNHAGDDIEGNEPLGSVFVAVDPKGNPDAAKQYSACARREARISGGVSSSQRAICR